MSVYFGCVIGHIALQWCQNALRPVCSPIDIDAVKAVRCVAYVDKMSARMYFEDNAILVLRVGVDVRGRVVRVVSHQSRRGYGIVSRHKFYKGVSRVGQAHGTRKLIETQAREIEIAAYYQALNIIWTRGAVGTFVRYTPVYGGQCLRRI